MDLFEALPVILPPNTCQLFPWDRIVRCLQLPAAPRGTRIVRFSFPRLRMGQESRDFPSRGSAWDKNRVIFLPAAPHGARIAGFSFPRLRVGQESCDNSFPRLRVGQESHRETLPPSGLGQETVFLASRRVVWSKKRVFFLSRRLGETRNVRKFTRVRRIPLYVRSPVITKL